MSTRPLFFLIITALLALIAWYFRAIISYVVIAAVISLVGQPVADLISKLHLHKYKVPSWLGALSAILLFYLLFFGFIGLIIPRVVHEAQRLSEIDFEKA